MPDAYEYLQKKINSLESSIETLDYQLTRLKNFTPAIQLKITRERRAYLNRELKKYKSYLKKENAK